MAGKEKRKEPHQPERTTKPKAQSETGSRSEHPEQRRAEQEEERTLKERAPEEPTAFEGAAQERSVPQREDKNVLKAVGPSRAAMEEGPFPIVGIGASAGGLEALEAFFDAVPDDSGLAFVVITHTDPEHESMLPDLLRRKTKISVKVIEEGMAAEPNTVYLPPSDRDPVLETGMFSLKKRPAKSKLHMPVDLFLKHLAEDRGELAACVILSGTGTDGTRGVRLIKEKAGLTVAQSPDSARHAGMPKSAMETGLVDYVLSPSEIPQSLEEYFKHPVAIRRKSEEGKGKKEPDPLRRILTFLAARTRHDFSCYKENTLVRRIEHRMTITRNQKASDYLGLLQRDPKEVGALFQDLLIGVTSFFRDPEAFTFLKERVLPKVISEKDHRSLRVWIPGCATGEEAYSVAMVLQECLEEREISREVQVFATDIDAKAIEKGRLGTYVQNIVSDVSPERLKRFFIKEESHYRLKSDIRELVVFAVQNVLADPPFSNLDLLVCRNLLIYLKPEAQSRLIPLFHYAIREGGILFLGTSEGVGRYHDLFEPLNKQCSIYRKKNHLMPQPVQFPTARWLEKSGEEPPAGRKPDQPVQSVKGAVEKVLMAEHTPPCVVVDQKGEILHFHGRTGKYLEQPPGEPTNQIADMAREGLRFAVLSALRRVNEESREIREKDVRVKTNHAYQRIDLVVKRISEPPLKDCRLVVFEALPEPEVALQKSEGRLPGEEDTQRAAELEKELMRVREDYRSAIEELQSSNEELRSTNEEIHSSNEELQSTNEELESSREELQSLNEELNTVNSELFNKIVEVKNAYNAINSVLNSTRIAIVFLDNDLRLRRFTPEATRLLNLIDADVGRPLDHITHNLECDDLAERARQVLKTFTPIDEEIRSSDGHWYRTRIMVYRPEERVVEGVVLTFIDIDAQKKAQKELAEMSEKALSSAKRFAESIVDTVRESLLVLDSRMRVVTANRSFYDTFRTTADETEGKGLFELGNRQWDIPALRKLLQEIIEQDKSFQDYLVEHRFPEIGFKRILLNARMLHEEDKKGARILLAMEDLTGLPTLSREEKSE
jgi:two-component system CheB/CheR fusion protein